MPIRHDPVILRGERMGDAISIDHRIMFFTTRPELADLDGRTFEDIAALQMAVQRMSRQRLTPAYTARSVE